MHKLLIIAGLLLILLGILIWLGFDWTKYLGRLPGDIRIERENFRFYFPITTMIILSIIANLIYRIFRWINQ
jgi:hypothetical protein